MKATLCSRNAHKARELEALLPGWTIEPLDRDDYPRGDRRDVLRERAAQGGVRARALRQAGCSRRTRASRSRRSAAGPGVHSARYAPEGAPAIAKLLGELEGVTDRDAHYTSELVLLAPDGTEYRGTGTLDGRIATEPSGTEGFGYDPVFVPDGEERTVAELGDALESAQLPPGTGGAGASSCARRRSRHHQLSSPPKTITFAIT